MDEKKQDAREKLKHLLEIMERMHGDALLMPVTHYDLMAVMRIIYDSLGER